MMVFFIANFHRVQSVKAREANVIIRSMVMFPQLGMRRQTRMIIARVGDRHCGGDNPMMLYKKTLFVKTTIEYLQMIG